MLSPLVRNTYGVVMTFSIEPRLYLATRLILDVSRGKVK